MGRYQTAPQRSREGECIHRITVAGILEMSTTTDYDHPVTHTEFMSRSPPHMSSPILERLTYLIPVLLSLSVHEWAHARAAYFLGDDTAKRLGRLTINPLRHIDPVGTVLLPLMGVPFGWAKPVPFDARRFTRPIAHRFGGLIVAAAGPISNFVLAGLGVVVILVGKSLLSHSESYLTLLTLAVPFVLINVMLAIFNLIPIPPLDGSHIAEAFMPKAFRPGWLLVKRYGFLLLLGLLIVPPMFGVYLLEPVLHGTMNLLEALITE